MTEERRKGNEEMKEKRERKLNTENEAVGKGKGAKDVKRNI